MPNTINKNIALEKIEYLVKLLKSKLAPPPFEQYKDPTLSAIDRLAEVFEAIKETQECPINNSKLPSVQEIKSSKLLTV